MAPVVQVLPPGENKTQKIAVGDLSGVVQCFCIKKGEVALTFKTLPSPQKACAHIDGAYAFTETTQLQEHRYFASGVCFARLSHYLLHRSSTNRRAQSSLCRLLAHAGRTAAKFDLHAALLPLLSAV